MKTMYTAILIVIAQIAHSQTPQGHYEGALTRDGSVQLISFDFAIDKTTYDIPEIGYWDVTTEKIALRKDTLNLKIFYGDFSCFLDSKTGDLTGISKDMNPKIRIHLKKTAAKKKSFSEEEIKFSNADVSLAGVLFKPKKSEKPIPYVILVHRSGWEDRNTPWYHSLAYSLASKGIGVLLYDKRGTGKSTGNFSSADFNVLADDAVSAFNYIKERKDLNYTKIGFIGASQGGWITPLAANKVSNCGFAILIVGPAVSLYEQDVNRVQYTLTDEGYSKHSIDSALHYSGLFFKYIQSNHTKDWEALKAYASKIKDKKWIDNLDIPQSQIGNDILWWRKNRYDPKEALNNIKCPVLSILGEKDVLVPPAENKIKMETYLKNAGVDYKIVIVKNCGHDMITKGELNGTDWNWPYTYWQWQKQPQEFFNSIFEFINK
ncbi:S9 family peptidase [Mucilaginibacter sp. SG564]|uniref:alpha/beta hydrolase family protein n=1 Tax=Mucilaginibacter sp. SG564 TaxID=2587022 RepID=UPI001551AC5F|nr:alpha/beta hydrolase [Mucilaginibacter sp. SG564]NOW93706.1 pimeloyl-ACP methyl ester carboxylesterase [Mucilaginibacter sp. SG564]